MYKDLRFDANACGLLHMYCTVSFARICYSYVTTNASLDNWNPEICWCTQYANFAVAGGTRSCHYDILQYHQWQMHLGPSPYKDHLSMYGYFHYKGKTVVRWLILTMGMCMLVRRHPYIKTAPRWRGYHSLVNHRKLGNWTVLFFSFLHWPQRKFQISAFLSLSEGNAPVTDEFPQHTHTHTNIHTHIDQRFPLWASYGMFTGSMFHPSQHQYM